MFFRCFSSNTNLATYIPTDKFHHFHLNPLPQNVNIAATT